MIQGLVDQLIQDAQRLKVSDIYVLPGPVGYQVRLRRAQGIVVWRTIDQPMGQRLLTYFKFHADMTVSEQRRPQVGALTWRRSRSPVDLRFSTVGDYTGRESMVIRLIYDYQDQALHYLDPNQAQWLTNLGQQSGLMLFAGPTGAGKTTTMYTVARQMLSSAMILTIEDPVEIKETQFIQLQVNAAAGLTYDNLIKVGLRHRPDVFIIGEIRDAVTAKAAVRAALSGHLVLSTVHAQTAAGTITRLQDLGVSEAVLRQVLTLASYQRLIPRIKQDAAVLFEQLTAPQMWQPSQERKGWRERLEAAVLRGDITASTAQKFSTQ